MELRVTNGVGTDELLQLKELFDEVRAHDDHEALGEHKWLDLVHGDGFEGIVASEAGRVVAYVHVARHAEGQWGMEMVVAPDHRGSDLEIELLAEALASVTKRGGGHVHWIVFRATERHEHLAHRLGFSHGRDLLYVCARLPVKEKATLPARVRLRGFEVGRDEAAWLDVNNRAFDHHPEQGSWDAEMLRRRMGEPWFDPGDFILATDDSGIAGFNWTKLHHESGTGEIYVIGINPSRQGAGLGKALTLAGLEHMAKRGMRRCCLYVDASNANALGMYRHIGFDVDHLDRAYVKDVDPG